MSQRLRSAPLRQENGRSGSAETSQETASRYELIGHSNSTGDGAFPVNRPRGRVRPGGCLVYALVALAALYIAGHVAVALVGWRGLALIACALIYVGAMAWSWATASTWRRP